jgi:hypothetical protein
MLKHASQIAILLAGVSVFVYLTLSFPTRLHIKTQKGLDCYYHMLQLSCNWDKYNHDTKYGEHPYAVDSTSDLEK